MAAKFVGAKPFQMVPGDGSTTGSTFAIKSNTSSYGKKASVFFANVFLLFVAYAITSCRRIVALLLCWGGLPRTER